MQPLLIGVSLIALVAGGVALTMIANQPSKRTSKQDEGVIATVAAFAQSFGTNDPDKLGWLDDAELSDGDRARIASLSGGGYGDNLGVIRSIQAGSRGAVTPRDFELLRQDRRRAQAAYPDVALDDLYTGAWLSVDLSAKIPDKFCTSGNSNGTQGRDGKWYLDGGCYVSAVKAEYTKREDAATTKRALAELGDTKRQKRISRIKKWGYSTSWSGTGGSGRVDCNPDPLPSNQEASDTIIAGKCVLILDSDRYEFAFDPGDWIDPPYGREGLEKLATAKGASKTAYVLAPAKPWVRKDGLLAHGETGAPGRLYWSQWNGDGYDNKDIGPSDPASWVIEQPFGIAYLPAPGNGEQRSDPSKPWYIVITYYGYSPQCSGGWTEQEAKDALPKFVTGHSFGMQGQDQEEMNRGNLREARATQIAPTGALMLADRSQPVAPQKTGDRNSVPYHQGMTLMPGQSTSFGIR